MNVLLNCFPPSLIFKPDLGLSVLKQYLQSHSIQCDIIYWNVLLHKIKRSINYFDVDNDTVGIMLPYLSILYPSRKEDIKYAMQARNPALNAYSISYYDELLGKLEKEINKLIDIQIELFDIAHQYTLIGLPYRFFQWIPGIILVNKLKKINPKLRFVMGGFGTKIEAIKFLESIECIDFAIWGEGEVALKQLCDFIAEQKEEYPIKVQSLVFRDKERHIVYNKHKVEYSELVIPDFSDFFKFNKIKKNSIHIPIERSRGCSWKGCKFCYLNEGYKFREKSNSQLLATLDDAISRHNIRNFDFHDNDLLGSDLVKTDLLLDKLINYRKRHKVDFYSAEINSKNTNFSTIKKLSKAGIKAVQIGIEALTDQKLISIGKQSTFINHIFAIKLCTKFDISVLGSNIIMGFPEDSISDVRKHIDNLHYLRFYFSEHFSLLPIMLAIKCTSRYYKECTSTDTNRWHSDILPFIDDPTIVDNKFYLFEHINKCSQVIWEQFNTIYEFYRNNKFEYTIMSNSKQEYEYKEFLNGNEIFTITLNATEWNILLYCNNTIINEEQIRFFLSIYKMTKNKFKQITNKLISERIIYQSEIDGSIFSIIDTDKLINNEKKQKEKN